MVNVLRSHLAIDPEVVLKRRKDILFVSLSDECGDLQMYGRSVLDRLLKERCDVIEICAALLNEFCMLNWTGPKQAAPLRKQMDLPIPQTHWDGWNETAQKCLSESGEDFYAFASEPILLYLAKLILQNSKDHVNKQEWSLWCMRCLLAQQKMLSEAVSTLWEIVKGLLGSLEELVREEKSALSDSQKSEVLLEMGTAALMYLDYDKAQKYILEAQELSGIKAELTGVLGKRTKFQENEIAQLVLNVAQSDKNGTNSEPPASLLPKNVLLNDDTVLDKIKFSDNSSIVLPHSPLQQAAVLSYCYWIKKSAPGERLKTEEIEAHLRSIFNRPMNWAIQSAALFLRCTIEKDRRIKVERSLSQLQELVDQFASPKPPATERLDHFYCSNMPLHWVLEKELASHLESLGCHSSAVEVYERLHLWQNVIQCYTSIGRHAKAEGIIREQLKIKESPSLWCCLGDVTKDEQYYLKSWEVSGERYFKAMTSLGMMYLREKKFAESAKCLKKSVNINFIQVGVWFALGHAHSQLDKFQEAAAAYHNCVTLEPENGEAWNNLAAMFIKLSNKTKAHSILQEALKRNFESWKIWENYLLVSMDVRAFGDAITAINRLMDLKDKYCDTELLGHLVSAVIEEEQNSSHRSASGLYKSLGELLQRVQSEVSTNQEVWRLCARYHRSASDLASHKEGLHDLQKAHRLSKQEEGWERTVEGIQSMHTLTLEYCQVCYEVCGEAEEGTFKRQCLSSLKLAVQGVIGRIKRFGLDDNSIPESISKVKSELEAEIENIKLKLEKVN